MYKRLVLSAFCLALCGFTSAAWAQQRMVTDAHVRLEWQRAEIGSVSGGEVRTVRVEGSDSSRRRRVRTRVAVSTYDRRLVAAVYRECARYRIDPRLVFSLIWQESGGKLRVVSSAGAKGALQLMPGTAAMYGVRNPFDPDQAVTAGVAYLVSLLDQFGGNVSQALAAYNAGSVPVLAFLHGRRVVLRNGKVVNPRARKTVGGIPPYRETQDYVESIAHLYRGFVRESANTAAASQ